MVAGQRWEGFAGCSLIVLQGDPALADCQGSLFQCLIKICRYRKHCQLRRRTHRAVLGEAVADTVFTSQHSRMGLEQYSMESRILCKSRRLRLKQAAFAEKHPAICARRLTR